MPKIRVLLIEDQNFLSGKITSLIDQQDDISITAINIDSQSLEIIKQLKPEVVMLRFSLKNQKSIDLAEIIGTEFPEIKVILFDFIPAHADIAEFIRAGISGVILKDANILDFLQAINGSVAGETKLPQQPLVLNHQNSLGRSNAARPDDPENHEIHLTNREYEVIKLITDGRSNKEIADQLSLSVHTVKTHVHNILQKLALRRRGELASLALKQFSR